MSSDPGCIVLNWNVRDLNNPARRQIVRELVQDHQCTIACLQETKLQTMTDSLVTEILGGRFSGNYVALPADGTHGGILLACSQDHYAIISSTIRTYSVTVVIQRRIDNECWTVTVVYGPQGDTEKLNFLQEIKQTKPTSHNEWMILGDFNLVFKASDKSNGRVNRRLTNEFRWVLNELELKELHLHGRRFTWTSTTTDPTLTKIDHVFCTREWEMKQPHCDLQALGSSVSNHCPMVLTCQPFHRRYNGFRFESWWLKMPSSTCWCNKYGIRRLGSQTRPEFFTLS
jgi:exonuclease III